jgi:hypothetical protein
VLVGEYRNTSDEEIVAPHLLFTFLDADGDVETTGRASPLISTIKPGESSPFAMDKIDLEGMLLSWDTEAVSTCRTHSDDFDELTDGLEVGDIVEIRKDPDWLAIEVPLTNHRDVHQTNVFIKVVVYRRDGKFAGSVSDAIGVTLPPGETARFVAQLSSYDMPGLNDDDDYSYRVWAQHASFSTYTCPVAADGS